MSSVIDRITRAAEARADALRARVAARLARLLPGIAVREDGDRIDLSGRHLVRRWLQSDAVRDWRGEEP